MAHYAHGEGNGIAVMIRLFVLVYSPSSVRFLINNSYFAPYDTKLDHSIKLGEIQEYNL